MIQFYLPSSALKKNSVHWVLPGRIFRDIRDQLSSRWYWILSWLFRFFIFGNPTHLVITRLIRVTLMFAQFCVNKRDRQSKAVLGSTVNKSRSENNVGGWTRSGERNEKKRENNPKKKRETSSTVNWRGRKLSRACIPQERTGDENQTRRKTKTKRRKIPEKRRTKVQ